MSSSDTMFTAGRGLRRPHAVLSCSCNLPLDPGLDSFGAVSVVRVVLFDHYASQLWPGATTYLRLVSRFRTTIAHICHLKFYARSHRCFHKLHKLHIGHRSQQVRKVSARASLSRSTHWAPSRTILSYHQNLKAPSTYSHPKAFALLVGIPRHDTLHSNHLRDVIRTQG